jgi:TrmH family RNA methyltransferase
MDRLRVVLVRSRNPLNIGAAARAMSNFGFHTLRLVAPWNPSYLDARSAVGASDLLRNAGVYGSVAEAVADCTLVVGTSAIGGREPQQPVQLLQQAADLICARLTRTPVAILFGSEKTGLSNEELSHCHLLMRIPTVAQHISMNLGQAVAVTLYELSRNAARFVMRPAEASSAGAGDIGAGVGANSEQVERLIEALLQALCISGYVQSQAEASAQEKLRRMMRRFNLNHTDATTLLGMLRKILWKLKHDEPTNSR